MRGCDEEAVPSTLPHRNAFFVVLIVTNRGDLQRQQAQGDSARDADMDVFVDSVQRWLTREAAIYSYSMWLDGHASRTHGCQFRREMSDMFVQMAREDGGGDA